MNNEYTDIAYERGKQHGEAEASWVFGGHTPTQTYVEFLRLYNDCDLPDDYHPRNPLSGEWAGESVHELLGDLLESVGEEEYEEHEAIFQHYEDGHTDGWWNYLVETANYMTQDLDSVTQD